MSKKLKSLDEHNSTQNLLHWQQFNNDPCRNGIACPNCGEELFDTNPNMTLTSMPPKKNVHCTNCDYHGYRTA